MANESGNSFHSWVNTFLQEAEELLAEIDDAALQMDGEEAEEAVNRLFRAFHTLKGSSGMCGLDAVAGFTHHIETLLDKMRSGQAPVTAEVTDLILAGKDHIQAMLEALRGGPSVDEEAGRALIERFGARAASPSSPSGEGRAPSAEEGGPHAWRIVFRPAADLFRNGGNPLPILRELRGMGDCRVTALCDEVPALGSLASDECHLGWSIEIEGAVGEEELRDVFMFVEDGARLTVEAAPAAASAAHHAAAAETPAKGEARQAQQSAATVKVPSERLDRLVNLVGELVMNQSRLNQLSADIDSPSLANTAQELERLVAELRNDVLGIRMLPIGTLFGRFRRLVHDLARDLDKEAELVTEGAETELDKSILDLLSEPLIHILRNSMDHGLESRAERQASGKPPVGRVLLHAEHVGSNVVISVSDDGAGIDRAAVLRKGVEKGLVPPDATLSDGEIFQLLLMPGFSTAAKVTNISGRGVGMDVVKRQIESLRGVVGIRSQEGKGTTIELTLPLTLAIIEGLLVEIAGNRYILPMSSVTENVELTADERGRCNGRNILAVRGERISYIDLRRLFLLKGAPPSLEKVVIIEQGEHRVGLVVDRILGTHQTVLQPLGRFFSMVEVASGATIMGDGEVALVLDIAAIIKLANRQAQQQARALAC